MVFDPMTEEQSAGTLGNEEETATFAMDDSEEPETDGTAPSVDDSADEGLNEEHTNDPIYSDSIRIDGAGFFAANANTDVSNADEQYSWAIPEYGHYGSVKGWSGKTVVWNQIINFSEATPTTINGITFSRNDDGKFVLNGTPSSSGAYFRIGRLPYKLYCERKYYLKFSDTYIGSGIETDTSQSYALLRLDGEDGSVTMSAKSRIITSPMAIHAPSDAKRNVYVQIIYKESNPYTFDNVEILPMIVDLTLMFGRGNEPTSLYDPRIRWIDNYVKAYPEHNAGELLSAKVDSIHVQGKNLFDESWLLNGQEWTNDNGVYSGNHMYIYRLYGPNTDGFPINFIDGKQYTLTVLGKCDLASDRVRFRFVYTDGSYTDCKVFTEELKEITLTSLVGKSVAKLFICYGNNKGKTYIHHLQVEEGSVATEYTPYHSIKLIIDNDRISFTKDGNEFGYWDGNNFYTGNIYVRTTERARFGNFAFFPRDDGSLSFGKVGD